MRVTDVGQYFVKEDDKNAIKEIWMMCSFCEYPSAILENVRTKERVGGAVGCLNLQPFVKLVPEEEVK